MITVMEACGREKIVGASSQDKEKQQETVEAMLEGAKQSLQLLMGSQADEVIGLVK